MLSDLAGGDPLLLQFYRGWWCPKEQTALRNLVLLQDEAEVAYTSFVSISVDPSPVTAAFRAGTLFPDLTIHSVYNGYWFWGRPTNEELRLDFRRITRQIRSDWEPPDPGRAS